MEQLLPKSPEEVRISERHFKANSTIDTMVQRGMLPITEMTWLADEATKDDLSATGTYDMTAGDAGNNMGTSVDYQPYEAASAAIDAVAASSAATTIDVASLGPLGVGVTSVPFVPHTLSVTPMGPTIF